MSVILWIIVGAIIGLGLSIILCYLMDLYMDDAIQVITVTTFLFVIVFGFTGTVSQDEFEDLEQDTKYTLVDHNEDGYLFYKNIDANTCYFYAEIDELTEKVKSDCYNFELYYHVDEPFVIQSDNNDVDVYLNQESVKIIK